MEVGDNVYLFRHGSLIRVETIKKLTKTLIRTENYNFRYPSKPGDRWLHATGQGTWSALHGELETPELKQQWDDMKLWSWWLANRDDVPVEEIKRLKALMEKK